MTSEWEQILKHRFANVRMVTSPRLRGQVPGPGLQQLLRDALPEFVAKLLPSLAAGQVWFVQERSQVELAQWLIPRVDLLDILSRPQFRPLTTQTRNTLTRVQLEVGQIFWVGVWLGPDRLPAGFGSGRLNLESLPAVG